MKPLVLATRAWVIAWVITWALAGAVPLAIALGASAGDAHAQAAKRGSNATPRAVAQPRRRTVVLDAGHGGQDPGMSGLTQSQGRIFEKDITLQVARRLATRLEAAGVSVVMTRSTDTFVPLSDRGRIANKQNGDLFISIHVNAANPNWKEPGAARGFETYFLAEAKTEDERRVAAMENEAVRFDEDTEAPKNDALGFMLSDMLQNEHLRESSDLADAIQSRLGGTHPGPSRGVKQAGFRVLVTAFMPSVLVEIGFGTNRAEAAWISSVDGQLQIADAITRATLDYLARYERRVGGGSTGKGQ
ncbi:MAG: N-acetylmuramoyl-L-alanine amidase [Gemmatimonadetes bacterium]|nr:N-acetylmuramoyl-L-alanine amidase [Gemmatimonadota bacterium]